MMSFIQKRITYVSFASGVALGLLLGGVLHVTDNPVVIVLYRLLVVTLIGIIAGILLKDKIKHAYVVTFFGLLYTYAISTIITPVINTALSIVVIAFLAVGALYFANYFINHTKIRMALKVAIAIIVFIVLFSACSLLGLYLARLTAASSI